MLEIDNTAIVMIDVQGKLVNVMDQKELLLDNMQRLVKGAQVLNVPIIWLEQYPQGLGPIDKTLREYIQSNNPIEKVVFSACKSETFIEQLEVLDRKTILVTGIEAHICVYQTVVDLLKLGHKVEVVVDCVSSRTEMNKKIGINKMKSLGAKETSVEMALFELIGTANHPKFREISKIIK